MGRLDFVQHGPDRLRVGQWRSTDAVAFVAPMPGTVVAAGSVRACEDQLRSRNYRSALTSALTEGEQAPFLLRGWTVSERLHLLRHDLTTVPAAPSSRIHRRARWSDRRAMLEVDAAGFDSFWRFDASGLADARTATPATRVRVVVERGRLLAFAITGRSGRVGYLQRIAVLPVHRRRGLGTALVADALSWCKRRGATSMLVNTQLGNEAALALYERLGFVRQPVGLAVLGIDLPQWT